ncbi:MAG: protein translocase subunit SecD [Planctomycetaceae bacterium]|nr:protein translocase subunit SecD [Planctomycetaceae bacterium]
MKWSSLFSRKSTEAKDLASVESHAGFRFMPYTLVVALALLAFSYCQQPLAQDDEGTAEPPVVVVVEEAEASDSGLQASEESEEEVVEAEESPVQVDIVEPESVTSPEIPAFQTPELPETGTAPEIAGPTLGEVGDMAVPPLTTPESDPVAPDSMSDANDTAILQGLQTPGVNVEAGPITTGPADEQEEQAGEDAEPPVNWTSIIITFGIFFLVFGVSAFLANRAAKAWRMPDHAYKFFLVLFTSIGAITATCLSLDKLTLGIDLSGGVVLVYDVKAHSDSNDGRSSDPLVSQQDFDGLIQSVNKRINPANIKEIDVRRYGTSQLKIVIPHADAAEVNRIVKIISEAGTLEFRILASRSLAEDAAIIRLAESMPGVTNVFDDGLLVAKWVPINKNELTQFLNNPADVVRQTGETHEVLVLKDEYDVRGEYLRNIHQGMFSDRQGIPRQGVAFSLNAAGSILFTELTTRYALGEQSSTTRYLGIIMSGEMYSAPTLNDPITGGGCHITFNPRPGDENNKQLQQDIKDLLQVMQAGALPADISKEPISRNEMGPTLGDATIRSAQISAVIALAGVFLFMIVYYRACGVLACLAVVMNFFLIMTVMLSIRAAFTLAGLAGLVLTLGMAIDANILIFERLREELAAGSTLRHAIRNAFSRASSAIIDSNLTTLFAAIILYTVGTEQTRGFAVTLFLGVVFSMYTAVFCLHVVFEVLERRGWLTRVTMLRLLNKPNIDFMALRKTTVTVFAMLCVISLLLAVVRGKAMYDIDFVGGVSVDIAFKKSEPMSPSEIENRLGHAGIEKPTVSTVSETIIDMTQVQAADQIGQRFTISTATPVGMDANDFLKQVTATISDQFGEQLILDTIDFTLDERQGAAAMETVAKITVYPSMNFKSLEQNIRNYSAQLVDTEVIADTLNFSIVCDEDPNAAESSKSHANWTVTFLSPKDDVQKVLDAFQAEFNMSPWFPASNTVGSVVAGYAQVASLAAIFASFVAMILYLWLRFQKVYFGLAAVATLINNILITLGALAISVWLKPVLAFALMDDFKIGLTVIAAFLTIIGYSINDTIILFDRVREVRGKSSQLTIEHINQSINQVLSRTLLTSCSTIYVVVVLYFLAGPGLRTFAYAMGVGITVGTFASIFLAAPLLYWMVNDPGKGKGKIAKSIPGKGKENKEKYDRKPQ